MAVEQKDFWSKPEGKLGIGLAVILGGVFLWGLYLALPFLITLAANTLYLAFLCAAIALIGYVIIDGSLLRLLGNIYKRVIRALYILTFNVDPIGGLKERIKELRQANARAREEAAKVKGESQKVSQTITANEEDAERALRRVEAAKRDGNLAAAQAEGIVYGVAQEANKPLLALKSTLDRSFARLQNIIEKSDLQVNMLDRMIVIKERSYRGAKAGRNAMKSAMAALRGDTEKDDVFKMNIDYVDSYTAEALGEMDAMLELNRHAIDSIDLDQKSYAETAFRELDARQGKVEYLLTQSEPAQKLLRGELMQVGTATPAPVSAQGGDFSHLFQKKGQ